MCQDQQKKRKEKKAFDEHRRHRKKSKGNPRKSRENRKRDAEGICEEQNQRNVLTSSTTLSHQTKPTDDVRKQIFFLFMLLHFGCIVFENDQKLWQTGGRRRKKRCGRYGLLESTFNKMCIVRLNKFIVCAVFSYYCFVCTFFVIFFFLCVPGCVKYGLVQIHFKPFFSIFLLSLFATILVCWPRVTFEKVGLFRGFRLFVRTLFSAQFAQYGIFLYNFFASFSILYTYQQLSSFHFTFLIEWGSLQ